MKQLDCYEIANKMAEAISAITKEEKDETVLNGQHKIVLALANMFLHDEPEYYRSAFENACFNWGLINVKSR